MITAYYYEDKKISSANLASLPEKPLVWIRAVGSDEAELQKLSNISDIPIAELKESFEEEERPRLTKKKYLELIYSAPHIFKEEGLQTIETYFYITKNLIITVESEKNTILERLEMKCLKGKSRFYFKNHGTFLFNALDAINDEFLYFIDRIAANLETVKTKDLSRVNTTDLYSKSITLAYFNQSVLANLEVLNQLRKTYYRLFSSTDRKNFTELYYDMLQILDTEKIQRELIMNLIDIQAISSTERLNHTIKKLTSLALLIALPTLITSMYGMNIKLPLEDNPYAFYILFGFMALSGAGIVIFMRKHDWV